MLQSARTMGANAVIGMKFELVELGNDMYQAISYGTAVLADALPMATPAFMPATFGETFTNIANDADAVVLPFQPRRAASFGARMN